MLAGKRAFEGDDISDTLRTATSLAVSLRKAGKQGEAMNLAQDTYERYRRRYGSDARPGTRRFSSVVTAACS